MKYFIHLAYSGARYRGWQRQPNAPSVQQVLEEALSQMLGEEVLCSSCGRTDALVHASQFFAHIKTEIKLNSKHIFIVNKILPNDIVVYEFIPVSQEAHAQKDAISRSYSYFIHRDLNPFISEYSAYYDWENFDLSAVKSGSLFLENNKDFHSLCREPEKYKSTLCIIQELSLWATSDERQICIRISADRFLRSMVRQIVGHLISLGKGELTLEMLREKVEKKENINPGFAAHPQGLYLSKVEYPFLKLETPSHFNLGLNNDFELL